MTKDIKRIKTWQQEKQRKMRPSKRFVSNTQLDKSLIVEK
ncbi:hypothetical protein LCGC14_2401720 [marine sediment metagenome]|uniref:Uncharacterized protein n=1 Tax=marine sediment metagenome TaxID=412755 RepID=A0A0F9E7I8_9ZZZZ